MKHIMVETETDFAGWRNAARALAFNHIHPDNVTWAVKTRTAIELFEPSTLPDTEPRDMFRVSPSFIGLAQSAILHRDPERFALLYRLLWRLREHPTLLGAATDPDVATTHTFAKEVHRDEHKMHAFVRFRELKESGNVRYVAWFEPSHHIVEKAAPFFERRFADCPWSILTPDRCAHWDGHKTIFTKGAVKSDTPSSDSLEAIWRTYYASIFNPARLKVQAMRAEMPKKYWRNLPEASLIDSLIGDAERISRTMIDNAPSPPCVMMQRKELREVKSMVTHLADTIPHLREKAEGCRACNLYKDATQTVFGEGAAHASIMLVGEQPGDKEDLAGRPFVGPAGQVLDRGLTEANIPRDKIYITNAVKHFKFVPRGKIRLHQKPSTLEIRACRPWYERELAAVKPALVVAIGATAAQCVFGKITPIGKSRGRLIDLTDDTKALVTVHPSYLLRLPDQDAKEREYRQFVRDLKLASPYVRKT